MGNPQVDRWRQRGRILVWTHVMGFDPFEWNFSADNAACDALVELLDLMERSKWSCKKAIKLKSAKRTSLATEAPHLRMKQRLCLILKYLPRDQVAEDHWLTKVNPDSFEIHFGASSLVRFRDAIVDIKAGNGDYAIGNDEYPLWMWWYCVQD